MTDKDQIILEAMLANEEMDRVARYLSRGRPLQLLDEPLLKRLRIDELRRLFREGSGTSASSEDISAELSLRGIKRVELPPDLKAAIKSEGAKIKRAMEQYPEFRDDFLNEINAVECTLAKPKN
jgi:hypothetical protein